MNRIFFALITISFLFGGWRQLTWQPTTIPAPTEIVSDLPTEHADPTIATLAREVAALRAAAAPASPAPPPPPMEAMQDAILQYARISVELTLKLIGAMAFFLGLMKVAELAGLLEVLAKVLQPLMVRLFPDVPADHPAMAAMILNFSANALGLGNAATPFGLKAMAELDSLNRHKGTATNAMVLFLAINTSSVTLLPKDAIIWRETLGSKMAAGILPTTLFATVFSTGAAILATKAYQRFWSTAEEVTPAGEIVDLGETHSAVHTAAYPLWVSTLAMAALVGMIPLSVIHGAVMAPWVIPTLTAGMITIGFVRGVPVYEAFVDGAREGWDISVRIVPYLVAILCAIGMFRASGAMDLLVSLIDPITRHVGLPAEALPMALLRPLSGSGAQGVMVDIMSNPATGPDTYTGFLVSTLMGSSETTFYVLAVYFGSIGVRRYRHTVAAALTADVAGVIGSIIAVSVYFAYNM